MRVAVLLAALVPLVGQDAPRPGSSPAQPADFRVEIENFGARKEPIRRAELLVREGRAYWLLSDANEVIVYEPSAGVVDLLDLERMQRTSLSAPKVEAVLDRHRRSKLADAQRLRRAEGRAQRLAGEMGRDVIEPAFQATFDAAANRLKLSNGSVEVDAVGEPEPDAVRRAFEADALGLVLKLEGVRSPDQLPPFCALDALRRLTREHRLRPLEITFLYRLAGPPLKMRWTYKLQPSLTERQRASLARVERARAQAKVVPFDEYEANDEP